MFSSGIALDLQIRNLRTKILEILQNLIPGIITNLNLKYNKTGGLISGDVEISGNVALTNTEISGVSQQTFQEDIVLLGAKIMMGPSASSITQGVGGVAIGTGAGTGFQGSNSVAIGTESGQNFQGTSAVAIGFQSGSNNQGSNSVAIGTLTGLINQGTLAVAIGRFAGRNTQGLDAIAVGSQSGRETQGKLAVAIGSFAGFLNQGLDAVAIGGSSGQNNQGISAVAIGSRAGRSNQASRSIILNATGVDLTSSVEDTFIVAPVREISGNKILQYDTTNKEISFSNTINISDNLEINTPILNITPGEKRVNQIHKFGYVSHFFQSTDIDAVEYNIEPYLNDEIIPNFYKIRIGFDDMPSLYINRDRADPSENRAVLNCARGKALVGDENVGNNTHIEVDDPNKTIILNTENITLNGSNLESNSSNGNSGRFLRIELNGTFYKINLELD